MGLPSVFEGGLEQRTQKPKASSESSSDSQGSASRSPQQLGFNSSPLTLGIAGMAGGLGGGGLSGNGGNGSKDHQVSPPPGFTSSGLGGEVGQFLLEDDGEDILWSLGIGRSGEDEDDEGGDMGGERLVESTTPTVAGTKGGGGEGIF